MAVPEIIECNSIFLLRSVHTGKGICIGFTTENPPSLPQGDIIHMCWLSQESVEKLNVEKRCYPLNRISCTLDEAVKIGVNFIRAATLYENGVKKDEKSERVHGRLV
jgi:hypothetical protein